LRALLLNGSSNILVPISLVVLFGCGPIESSGAAASVTVADLPAALTTQPSDGLFTLTLSNASKPYVLTDLMVSAGLPGTTEMEVNFKHEDTDGGGLFDAGESLTCTEPIMNFFDGTTVGKAVKVGMAERRAGTLFTVATATWTPAN
jgi:hypothetical protein